MATIARPAVLDDLVRRLERLRPDMVPRWGVMSAGEMVCHLGDAHEAVLGTRVPPGRGASGRSRPLIKWIALRAPLPWPRGFPTRAGVDPRREGTRPGDFGGDRDRAIASLRDLATADPHSLAAAHSLFGPMSARDWHRWAYRHVGHHLRQFGLLGGTGGEVAPR